MCLIHRRRASENRALRMRRRQHSGDSQDRVRCVAPGFLFLSRGSLPAIASILNTGKRPPFGLENRFFDYRVDPCLEFQRASQTSSGSAPTVILEGVSDRFALLLIAPIFIELQRKKSREPREE